MWARTSALGLVIAIIAVQSGSAFEAGSVDGDLQEPDLTKLGESLELGESQASPVQVAPNKLEAQNAQLQGAIAAIQNGTPPPGMEAMLGGADGPAPAADAGAAAVAAPGGPGGESASISKGIKMAMSSVKPLMDKYVATARALTDKYTKLQAVLKDAKKKLAKCPSEDAVQARIKIAVDSKAKELKAQFDAEEKKKDAYIAELKKGDAGQVDRLTTKVAELQAFEKQAQVDFGVQIRLAKTKAKANMEVLQEQLRAMIMNELARRDRVLKLKQERSEKAKIGAKAKKELTEKKEAANREAEAGEKRIAQEKVDKKEEAKEMQTKTDAAEEVKTLNRETVMRKARKAMNAARHAARMARTVVRDTARNLDDARLEAAKAHALDDVKALSKLRKHQDLAIQAQAQASEKQRKVARFEFNAKHNLHEARKRVSVVAKKNRFEDRHARTLRAFAQKAADKAEVLQKEAKAAAEAAKITPKEMSVPEVQSHPASSSTNSFSGDEKDKEEPSPEEQTDAKIEKIEEEKNVVEQERTEAEEKGASPEELEKLDKKVMKLQKAEDEATDPNKAATDPNKAATDPNKAAKTPEEMPKDMDAAQAKTPEEMTKNMDAAQAKTPEEKTLEALEKAPVKEKKSPEEKAIEPTEKAVEKEEDKKTADAIKGKEGELKKEIEATEQETEAAKEGKEVKKAPIEKKPEPPTVADDDSPKTKAMKLKGFAEEATLKTKLAHAKIKKAKVLRKAERDKLKSEGKPIPESLKKGSLKGIEDKAAAATVAAEAATEAAKKKTTDEPAAEEALGEALMAADMLDETVTSEMPAAH